MNDESRPKAAPEDSAVAAVSRPYSTGSVYVTGVIERRNHPHELHPVMHDLWRDGFTAGWLAAQPLIQQARADADRYYYLAFNSEEAQQRHKEALKAFDVARNRASTAETWAVLDRIAAERAAAAQGGTQ
ncbi:hypothetical protein V6S02_06020 [Microbacterium sp. CCNWLW134]|uniref:hypothetical protein n=1 Tax=Microbacterium sp. CCNWLW134 TaxID=3122064 RepID=UPI00301039FB